MYADQTFTKAAFTAFDVTIIITFTIAFAIVRQQKDLKSTSRS